MTETLIETILFLLDDICLLSFQSTCSRRTQMFGNGCICSNCKFLSYNLYFFDDYFLRSGSILHTMGNLISISKIHDTHIS